MRYIDIEDLDQLPGIRLKSGDSFQFRCHSALTCFNRCCRNLNLFLYPYDVVRLRRCLGISSDQFLEQYVDVVLREENAFPEVLLRMADTQEKTCPFLTPEGCGVYPDRPDACRTFPVEQGVIYDARTRKDRPVHFFRPPDFCLGQKESKQWSIRTWTADQEASDYHRMTARWAHLKRRFRQNPWGAEGPQGTRAKMAFMATYNIDSFRDFILESSFLKRYRITKKNLKKIRTSDTALLKLGFEWVEYFLWRIPSSLIRPR